MNMNAFKLITLFLLTTLPIAVLVRDWKFHDRRTRRHHNITRTIIAFWCVGSLAATVFAWLDSAQIEELIDGKNTLITQNEEAEARREFLVERDKPLKGGSVILVLKKKFSPNELGHFRFMAQILNLHESDPHPSLWIAGRDAYTIRSRNGVSYRLIGTKSLVWSQNPDEQIQNTIFGRMEAATTQLDAGGHLYKRGPFKTIGDLEDRDLSIYVTKPLYDQIAGIYLTANNLIISGAEAEHFIPLDLSPLVDWPEPLTEDEANVPWIAVTLKIHDPPGWMVPELARTSFKINFSEYTPRRLGK